MNANCDNVFHRKVLVEKLTKLSYIIKKEQKLYKTIDVKEEMLELLIWGDLPGIYIDDEFYVNKT